MTKQYIVTGENGANLRAQPSTSTGNVIAHVPHGTTLEVVDGITATNAIGTSTKYLHVLHNGQYLWCSSALLAPVAEHTSHLSKAGAAAKKVYGMIYNRRCRHASGANSYDTMYKKKVATCAVSASAVLQEAGCIPVGKVISHTTAVKRDILRRKNTLDKAATGMGQLIKGTCDVVRVGKCYAQLPAKYQKAGMVYIQDSNVCVSGGNGVIYSCNQSGKRYGKGGASVRRTNGYPFTSPILYVIAPKN